MSGHAALPCNSSIRSWVLILIIVYISLYHHADSYQYRRIQTGNHRYKRPYNPSIRGETTSISASYSFLCERDESAYSSRILALTIDNVKTCISKNEPLIEVEFPVTRKSDIGVGETLDRSIDFTIKLTDAFKGLGQKLWVLLPDRKEAVSLRKRIGSDKFAIGSIDLYPPDSSPKLIIIVNPGFNVDEWINIPKIVPSLPADSKDVSVLIINGNIGRLRNGYYPSIFYPGLSKVTPYYKSASQALYLAPVSINGNRFGAWTVKSYSEPWQLLVRTPKGGLDLVQSSGNEFDPKNVWKVARDAYLSRWPNGGLF